jgi:LysM repeat protein
MKNQIKPLLIVLFLVTLVGSLAACEKERPVPRIPTSAVGTPGSFALLTPLPGLTTGGVATADNLLTPLLPTPVPLNPPSPTPEPPDLSAGTEPTATVEAAPESWVYTVAAGDSLIKIAQKFQSTTDAILDLNPGLDPDVLVVGEQIKIPGEAPAQYGGYVSYTIQPGDTLSAIAQRFDVSAQTLLSINGLTDPDQLGAGQVIKVPGNTAAAQVSPTAAAEQTTSYTVQPGDTLSAIAVRFGTTTRALEALNSITDPTQIYPGEALDVPAGGSASASAPAPAQYYTVQHGDTVLSIARRLGVSANALMAANGLANPNLIRVGEQLRIP